MVRVDKQFDVQTVIAEQVGAPAPFVSRTGKLRRIRETDSVASRERRNEHITVITMIDTVGIDVGVAYAVERNCSIEKSGCTANDLGPARGVVVFPSLLAMVIADRIRAVKRIVQAPPSRVGRVDGKAGVGYGNDKLRASNLGYFAIDVFCFDRKRLTSRYKIGNVLQEGDVFLLVPGLSPAFLVPCIDFGLHLVSFGQKGAVDRRQVSNDRLETGPKSVRFNPDQRQELTLDKLRQHRGYR